MSAGRLRQALEHGDLERVLVRAPNWLGDVVMAAPTVVAISSAIPAAMIPNPNSKRALYIS